jgi:hypothetical protein
VALATPGHTGHYVGNWTVGTLGTSAVAPVTIMPAPGVAHPILDGNHGDRAGCRTTACNGPVLTVGRGVHVDLRALTIENADDTVIPYGGGAQNIQGGTLTVVAVTFSSDQGTEGAAIDNGDNHGDGTLAVSGSTFSNDTASNAGGTGGDGGAIDNGDHGGEGAVSVSGSTFSDDSSVVDGGAIDNGDNAGKGTVSVSGSKFDSNLSDDGNPNSAGDGGAIDNADHSGHGTLTVSTSLLTNNSGGGTYGNSGNMGNGGAIDNGDQGGDGTVTVSGSALADNSGGDGGAINNANGVVSLSASTVAYNQAVLQGGGIENNNDLTVSGSLLTGNESLGDGGAIDNWASSAVPCACAVVSVSTLSNNQAGVLYAAPFQPAGSPRLPSGIGSSPASGGAIENAGPGTGSLLLWASTFTGNSETQGGDVDSGDAMSPGSASVLVAANIFDGTCHKGGGTWHDLGYNVGDDGTCLRGTKGDVDHGAGKLASLADNGGPTYTILPLAGNPALGLVPYGTTLKLGGAPITLCPATDERGKKSAPGRACDAGAVQG